MGVSVGMSVGVSVRVSVEGVYVGHAVCLTVLQ